MALLLSRPRPPRPDDVSPVAHRYAVRSVVINADDFGLHPAVNRGIVQAHREGVVTSASLMACGRAFTEAVQFLRACPTLGVGIHLTLVEEQPVSPPERIPSLVNGEGRMPKSYWQFAQRWLSGRIRAADLRVELESQIRRILDAGIRPTHADGHQHVHCLPGVWPIVVELVQAYQIPFLRLPRFASLEGWLRQWSSMLMRAGVNMIAGIHRWRWPQAVRRADALEGLSLSGRLTSAQLLKILDRSRPGLTEIMVHPGSDNRQLQRLYCEGPWRGFDWEGELAALTDERVKRLCRQNALHLTHFGDMAARA